MEHQAGTSQAAAPVTADDFAARMRSLGPFEPAPHVAVGCSGGGDSMALTLLLHQWCAAREGQVTALIVDHRIRPESADEADRVAAWLSGRGIENQVLTRPDEPLRGNLQAAARDARYALLSAYCAKAGILHLALAHNLEDQAETVLLRLARGSGVDGLAAMAPVTERPELRLLRPLLDVPRARLRATLQAAGQAFIEDPRNEEAAFKRVRLRQLAPALAVEGLTPARLAATASQLGRARDALEGATAAVLADRVRVFPEGYGELDGNSLRDVPQEIALRCLARLLTCIGGRSYPPRLEPLQRLYAAMTGDAAPFAGRTLAGCRIVPRRGKILVCREVRAIREAVPAAEDLLWDGRFRIRLAAPAGLQVRRLGRAGWAMAVQQQPELRKCRIPAPVRPSLPAVWDLDVVVLVPHLNYIRADKAANGAILREIAFTPARPLTAARFAVHKD
jgi:tRNA(Ile)-lysidine synthase